MQLTRQQILELAAAFRRLDGERGKSFKFGAKTRLQLAQRIRRLTGPVEDLQSTQKKLFAQYELTGGMKRIGDRMFPLDDPAKSRAYSLEWNDFCRQTDTIEVGKFLLADLDLQTNSVSVQVLAHLLVVITDLPKPTLAKFSLSLRSIDAIVKAFAQLETDSREFKASYQVKLALADIWRQLAAEADKGEVQRQAMVSERKLGNYRQNADKLWEPIDDAASLKAFEKAWDAVRDAPLELELPTVKVNDLDLETNDIPGSVLSDLLPILVEEPEPAAAKDG